MGSTSLYEPISLVCVLPGLFPRVALYAETNGRHVLYKEESLPFTELDRDRLLNSKTDTLFVRSGDFEEVADFAEKNLPLILKTCGGDTAAKCAALTQVATTYLNTVFTNPEQARDIERCTALTGHLAGYISEYQNIADLILTLGEASPFAVKHSMQVAVMSMLVWSKLFPEQQLDLIDIGVAGLLHDIGMALILKDALEEKEYWTTPDLDEIKRHPFEGYVFLRKSGHCNELVLDAVRHHHERYFGGGYPGG